MVCQVVRPKWDKNKRKSPLAFPVHTQKEKLLMKYSRERDETKSCVCVNGVSKATSRNIFSQLERKILFTTNP